MGISSQNQKLGIELLELYPEDFEEFKNRVDTLPQSDRDEIAWWLERLYLSCFDAEGSA